MPSRFLIVEDHPLFAEALLLILRRNKACNVVTLTKTLAEAQAALSQVERFDLVLLDLRLPDALGFEGLLDLRNRFPKLPIVVVTAVSGQSVRDKAIIFGASAFIAKSASRDAFLGALDYVIAGPEATPTNRAALLESGILTPATSKQRPLTHQQLRVLQAMCQGLQNKQIAIDLDIAETTVKAHVSEILRKLHVSSRTQAVLEVSKLEIAPVATMYAAPSKPESHVEIRSPGLAKSLALATR